ncbi:MAG: hypothetical protein CVU71_07460 [Deltaproteobacteria bacterium HGW-Deltaproteobacteria-6]|nr:MAG: hypothetical protein CVU71_07460 [Deltaproteobacteria bacterium HGW-Deltaproteobacteria-6]
MLRPSKFIRQVQSRGFNLIKKNGLCYDDSQIIAIGAARTVCYRAKTMKNMLCALSVFLTLTAAAAILACPCRAAGDTADPPYIKYSVSDQEATIVSAATPYDSDPKARDAFLHWFKVGFHTVLNGASPLMIEWQNSPEGKAGRRGYDFGMDEAEKYLKEKKEPRQLLQTMPIPPD